ncbi:MAG: conjugal transfer protein TraC, partial [Patescibacteria group bacterium]|nr:conjugal transfer protein TraC [Patescibacteria group bacterium]
NEYKELSDMLGGSYLRISLTSQQRINPFDLPRPIDESEEKPGALLRSAVITLSGLMELMLGKFTSKEAAIIDQSLLDTYAVKGITMDTVNPGEVTPPTMEDFYNVLSTTKGAEELAIRLRKYVDGTFGGIFNKPTNVNMASGLMVFSVRDLDDSLRPIAMYIVLNYIWNTVRSDLKKRMLVIDEAWSIMQYEDSAKFLHGLIKRARKYYLGVTTITQNVEDFFASTYGKALVTNSSMQLLLKQSPAAVDKLKEVFKLTEGEVMTLLNSDVGQGIFFAGQKHVSIQVISSYGEHQIITTNPEEILKQQNNEDEEE